MKKVLWLAPKLPYPPSDGARYASYALIKGVADIDSPDVAIDLIVVASLSEAGQSGFIAKELGLRSLTSVAWPPFSSSSWAKLCRYVTSCLAGDVLPATVASFAFTKLASAVSAATKDCKTLVYDGLHVAAHSVRGGTYIRPPHVEKIVYRAHNCESQIWYRLAARYSNPLIRHLINRQADVMRRFEISVLRSVDQVAAVSGADLASLKDLYPALRATVVPIGFEFSAPLDWCSDQSCNLLFAGRLDWPPNRQGLQWFLSEVWPRAYQERKSLRLIIAGSGDGGWLKSYRNLAGVSVLGYCRDLQRLYAKTHLCIVPVFFGSGTRVKVLEAARWGRPCLSTALGVEGSGLVAGHSYLQAETVAQWIECLLHYDQNGLGEEIGVRAFNLLKLDFSIQSSARKFFDIITG